MEYQATFLLKSYYGVFSQTGVDSKAHITFMKDTMPDPYFSLANIDTVVYANESSQVILKLLGVEETSKNFDLNVFPNPNEGKFNIQFSGALQVEEIGMTDMFGKKVYSLLVHKYIRELSMDVPGLPSCVYLLRIISKEKIVSSKLVIQKP